MLGLIVEQWRKEPRIVFSKAAPLSGFTGDQPGIEGNICGEFLK